MRFRVLHETRFRYSEPVYLEPHICRLRPRCDSAQRLVRHRLEINPTPKLVTDTTDAEGNTVTYVWFGEKTEVLSVRAESEVQTLQENPYRFLLLDEAAGRIPAAYPEALKTQLAAALGLVPAPSDPLREFVRDLVDRAAGRALSFLAALNGRIHASHAVELRKQGEPLAPDETLRRGRGACRDLAVLFVSCCRIAGIAARFVSGYQRQIEDSPTGPYMHAWAEAYLPGAGWVGYDPSQGLLVADRHVTVATSAIPSLAAPLSGTFRGRARAEPLAAEITVAALPADEP